MKIRKPYDPHKRCFAPHDPKSLAHQSMAAECDINSIMKKYEKTGVLEHRNTFEGQYGDFTDVPQDYHESMNAVIAAEEMFSTLPARLRRRFHNDPGAFIQFVSDPSNKRELVTLGLATEAPQPLIEEPTPPKKAAKAAEKGEKPAGEE